MTRNRHAAQDRIGMTLEEFEFEFNSVSLELEINYTLNAYHPAVRYLANGDPGYPEEGGDIDDVGIVVTFVQFAEDEVSSKDKTPWRVAMLAEVQREFDRQYKADAKLREEIDRHIYEHGGHGEEDDGDARYEAQRDMRDERRREARDECC